MAIKVLIERTVKAGREELVWDILRDLRGEAVRQRGYLYGETWRSLDNPRVVHGFEHLGPCGLLGKLGPGRFPRQDGSEDQTLPPKTGQDQDF